jgi:hypothetical protein
MHKPSTCDRHVNPLRDHRASLPGTWLEHKLPRPLLLFVNIFVNMCFFVFHESLLVGAFERSLHCGPFCVHLNMRAVPCEAAYTTYDYSCCLCYDDLVVSLWCILVCTCSSLAVQWNLLWKTLRMSPSSRAISYAREGKELETTKLRDNYVKKVTCLHSSIVYVSITFIIFIANIPSWPHHIWFLFFFFIIIVRQGRSPSILAMAIGIIRMSPHQGRFGRNKSHENKLTILIGSQRNEFGHLNRRHGCHVFTVDSSADVKNDNNKM